ncbi:hypothetical protein Axy23_032 [Achromobacter phage vB_AxyP_19-32_Axy23]|uniref:N-acetyltransferase domain-containing protein n=1 Tax=Achromobacter phage vB_AxyP_19-32_Axy23 TaxID=2591047 RepID=A0A514CW63_9CAUD|nr:hypothetical protein Axy23_032 [Achromobacter phage vB_AxyP_19-32_Axy23]
MSVNASSSNLRLISYARQPGDFMRVPMALWRAGWAEYPEFHQPRSFDQFLHETLRELEGVQRVELLAFDGPEPVGGLIFGAVKDLHVGTCLGVLHMYIRPEYRGGSLARRLIASLFHFAAVVGFRYVAMSHRRGPFQYTTTYRKVQHVHGQTS